MIVMLRVSYGTFHADTKFKQIVSIVSLTIFYEKRTLLKNLVFMKIKLLNKIVVFVNENMLRYLLGRT